MRFLLMHRLDESVPEAWNPSPEFIERMGAYIQEKAASGVLLTGEGVHKSDKGAMIHKGTSTPVSVTDGPFTEAKEVIGGFALINAKDLPEAVAIASEYAELFDGIEVSVEVRQVAGPEDFA